MDNLNVIPEAITREDHYLKFLAVGGDINLLPEPISRRDNFLYDMCLNGGNIGGLSKRVDGFYRCTLNSDTSGQNFCSGILDLGEKKVTSAKFIGKLTLRGTEMPTAIGLKLFANNSAGRDIVAGYSAVYSNVVVSSNIATGKEFILEGEFVANANSVNLNTCRYLKPFIELQKANSNDTGKAVKHIIDLYEMSIEVDGIVYDITDTVADFAPIGGSDIKYINSEISEQGLEIRKAPWFGDTVACIGDSITFGMLPGGQPTQKVDNPWVSQLRNYCGFTNIRNYGISGNRISGGTNPMHTRVEGMDPNANAITAMGAINDVAAKVPLGEFKEDDTQLDVNTFYGALQTLYKALKDKYPNNEEDKKNYMPDDLHPNQAGHDIMAKVIGTYINSLAYLFNAA